MDEYSGFCPFFGIQLIRESFGTLKENARQKHTEMRKKILMKWPEKGEKKALLQDHTGFPVFATDEKKFESWIGEILSIRPC